MRALDSQSAVRPRSRNVRRAVAGSRDVAGVTYHRTF